MGRIQRGWELARISMGVLRRDQSLAVFPILSTISIIIAAIAIGAPGYLLAGADPESPLVWIVGAVIAFVSTYLTIFFNVALVSCAVRSFEGADTTVGEGIAAANSRAGIILRWALLATTVGLLLRALEERLPLAGQIAVRLVGAGWAIATYFVVPVIAFEEVGPVDAVKRSVAILRGKWGETAVGHFSITLAVGLATMLGAGVLAVMGFLLVANALPLAVMLFTLAVLVVIAGSVLGATLTQIFNVALYSYAQTGAVPNGFHETQLNSAFAAKR